MPTASSPAPDLGVSHNSGGRARPPGVPWKPVSSHTFALWLPAGIMAPGNGWRRRKNNYRHHHPTWLHREEKAEVFAGACFLSPEQGAKFLSGSERQHHLTVIFSLQSYEAPICCACVSHRFLFLLTQPGRSACSPTKASNSPDCEMDTEPGTQRTVTLTVTEQES